MQTQKITKYLYGEMNPKELNDFEKELATDLDLQGELKLHQEIDQTILNEIKVNSFRQKLEFIHEKEGLSKKIFFLNLQSKWYWAAASITVITGTAAFSISKYNQSPDRLYNKYYEIWQPSFTTRGIEEEKNMDAILKLFESGNYLNTIETIDQLPSKENNSPKLWLLKGCAYMELKEFDQAIQVFRNFDTATYTFYTETALWYNALCYLKTNKVEEAKIQMQQIVKEGNSYSKEALDILDKMN